MAAFFLESTFLGLWVFGWDKLSRRVHLACIWLVAAGSMLSAAFILAANSWMQHPVGYKMVGGKPQLDNIVAVFTNPVFLWGYGKVVLASVTTGTLVMLAVSAWQLRKGKDPEIFGHSLRLSLIVLVPAITLTLFVGDMLGVVEGTYQPMKIAAAEAQWTTCQPCSFSLFQIGGGNNDHTPVQIIQVPHLLSLLATNTWNGKVVGMTPLQNQYSAKYGPGDYVPNVFIQYWGMRVMAYLGGLVWVFALWGAWLLRRKKLETSRLFLWSRDLGRHHAVPDEHRGLAPDRKRPPAVDRAGDHAHQERDLPVEQLHLPGHQRDRLHRALPRPGRAVPGLHAAVLPPRTRTGPAAGGRPANRTPACPRCSTDGGETAAMTLAQFWFILIAVLWTGFFVLEGFDLGVGMLHSVIGRDEPGRRAVINTIGPLWDGNEVWLIVAGAAIFAAFPGWYATWFSALYLALVLLLAALMARGTSFEFRGKRDSAALAAAMVRPAVRRQPARPAADRHRAG